MLAAWYESKGKAREVLHTGELPDPEPGPGELRVRIRASGINPTDTKARGGFRGNLAMPFPRIVPHQDGAGVVDRVGPGVSPERIGERVWVYEAQWRRASGTAAQLVTIPQRQAVPLPEGTSFAEGACLGIPAITAHHCLFADGPLQDKTVLIAGGAGAVGYYAVQLARLAGARVITTVGSERDAKLVRELGAYDVLDRRDRGLGERIRELTQGLGVDRVVEVALGTNLPLDVAALAPSGAIAAYSSDAEPEPPLPFGPQLWKNATIRFVLVYLASEEAHLAAVRDLSGHLAAGRLRHSIAKRLPLSEIAAAHEAVETGHLGGKVVLDVP